MWKPYRGFNESSESACMKKGTLFLHRQRSDALPSWAAISQWGCRKDSRCMMVFFQSDFLSCWASHLACVQRQSRKNFTNWQRFAQSCKIWRVVLGGWHDSGSLSRVLHALYTVFIKLYGMTEWASQRCAVHESTLLTLLLCAERVTMQHVFMSHGLLRAAYLYVNKRRLCIWPPPSLTYTHLRRLPAITLMFPEDDDWQVHRLQGNKSTEKRE